MRVRCAPSESSEHHRPFNFVPPDPDHSAALVARCREELKKYDPYLNVWWSPLRGLHAPPPLGRWRIVCYIERTANWDHVHYWENEHPTDAALNSYRAPSASEMLAKVQELDIWRKGEGLVDVSRRIDIANERRAAKAKEDRHTESLKDSVTFADLVTGKLKHFDMSPRGPTP